MYRKLFTVASFIVAAVIVINAQEIVTTHPQLKGVVLEEYTGLNCPYCPQGHTVAESILSANPDKVSVIAVHQGYYATPSDGQPDFRTSFANSLAGQTNLEGYPSGTINRHFFQDLSTGGGTALNRGDWTAVAGRIMEEESYVNLGVSTSYNDVTRELSVTVEAYYVEDLPFGVNSNFFQIAITESNIMAYQAGATSPYNHKHMLRHLITGQWGDEITEVAAGSVVSRTYTYIMPEEWVAENCEVVAFITETRQEIITGVTVPLVDGLNDGLIAADYSRLFTDTPVAVGQEAQNSVFDFTLLNGYDADQNFVLTLTYNAPADWTISFDFNGTNYTDMANIALSAYETSSAHVTVVPGSNPGVAKCTLTLASSDFPGLAEKVCEVFVVSGVENMVVNGSGTGSGVSSYEFEPYYTGALSAAGCQTFGAIPGYAFEQAVELGALTTVRNLYMNIGGTTPVLTLGQVLAIREFVDNGGNLFISGQDIARDIWATGGTSVTGTHKSFFQNYMSAVYLNDGDAENNLIQSVNTDSVFGFIPSSALIDAYDGVFDPDAIRNSVNSFEIFLYPNGKAGALRAFKGSAKIVYLAFGLEQISNEDTRNDIMDRTYRWFEGWEGTGIVKNEQENISLFPNPSNGNFSISDIPENSELYIYSITGQLVKSINSCSDSKINIAGLQKGCYQLIVKSESVNYNTTFVVVE